MVSASTLPVAFFRAGSARNLCSKENDIRDFDPILAKRMINEEKGILIDCRTLQEFQSGAPEEAVLIPNNEIPSRLDEVHG